MSFSKTSWLENTRGSFAGWLMLGFGILYFLWGYYRLPFEPMIPLLYFLAAQNSWAGMLLLIVVYTCCTLITMLALVLLGY